ncbi:hypothetical protein [Endozoicomonas sp. Mp262]|uniref:hypothetical protein n=1 Tax=Endozoicomonas sp. Mp262 TaxID=2919499 RepID=UPI0021DA4336
MGMCSGELRHYIIRPSLKHIGMWSLAGENLLLGTAACESGLGTHIKFQNHQSLGLYQISPKMHKNIWDNFLAPQPELSSKVRGLASQREFLAHPHYELVTNLSYSSVIAWLIYYRTGCNVKKITPGDILGLGKLWHKYFHNHHRPSSPQYFVSCYHQLISVPETTL